MIKREVKYSIDELYEAPSVAALAEPTPSSENNFSDAVGVGSINSGALTAMVSQEAGALYSGKDAFDNTQTGYRLGIDDGVAKFYIGNTTQYLNWTGTELDISGAISASTIDIGGADATSFHVDADGNLWLGNALFASAPFKVSNAGDLTASSVSITGGSISGSTTVGIGNVNLAARGWTQTSIFSVTDADTVAWGAGTFTSADGTAYSIGGGNTGNMAAATYIYLDIAVSTTAYQSTTTAATAVGAGKVLIAKAQNGTGEATFQVFGGIGGQNIAAESIVANSITANELSTAITYAGSIVIDTDGLIRSGQTDYATGTGWWLGDDGGTPKFSIGDANNFITWNGTTLAVQGVSNVTKLFTAGEALSTGQAVFLADGNESSSQAAGGAGASFYTIDADADWYAQTFTARSETGNLRIASATVYMSRGTGATGNVTFAIYATSAGAPTGAALATATESIADIAANGSGGAYTAKEVTFASPLTLTGATVYALVVSVDTLAVENVFLQHASGTYGNGSVFTSTDSGANWDAGGGTDMRFDCPILFTTSGSVYLTDAGTAAESESFTGFVKTTTALAGSVPVFIAGEATGLSGLTTGSPYYLSDTAGAVSTSAGTVTRKVGIALSTTSMLITNIW